MLFGCCSNLSDRLAEEYVQAGIPLRRSKHTSPVSLHRSSLSHSNAIKKLMASLT